MKRIELFVVLCCSAVLFAACDTTNNHKYVDLGLPSGTLWATCNVGATKPEQYGNYYAWGETKPKETYKWSTYKYCDTTSMWTDKWGDVYPCLTKYCTDATCGKDGFVDGKTTLEAADDAATANWGGKWRMPTDAEWEELTYACKWKWTDDYKAATGVAGYLVTGNTGNSIFLPAAGSRRESYNAYYDEYDNSCDYWSSSLNTDYPKTAYGSFSWKTWWLMDYKLGVDSRYAGLPVRPVRKNK